MVAVPSVPTLTAFPEALLVPSLFVISIFFSWSFRLIPLVNPEFNFLSVKPLLYTVRTSVRVMPEVPVPLLDEMTIV